ncbi:hypothetical protein LTR37_003541 [Vermiconidia calcicola]|uniref:Uncharacterized protein n=1 Tax=Vermiconidia calcicola TaxID=1690605 RepID=A0ACC3NSF6_9PEZI|nr:hypothetical protein LTR37_003541 [Vermiconidia calcicola]
MDDSPLAKLSAELHNGIYHLALRSEQPVTVVIHRGKSQEAHRRLDELKPPQALTLTCQQIRNESTQVFYSANTFDIPRFYFMIQEMNMKALRSITISALTFDRRWETGCFARDYAEPLKKLRQASKRIPNSSVTAIAKVRTPGCKLYSKVKSFNLDMQDFGKPWTATCEQLDKTASEHSLPLVIFSLKNTREKVQWCQQYVQIAEAE